MSNIWWIAFLIFAVIMLIWASQAPERMTLHNAKVIGMFAALAVSIACYVARNNDKDNMKTGGNWPKSSYKSIDVGESFTTLNKKNNKRNLDFYEQEGLVNFGDMGKLEVGNSNSESSSFFKSMGRWLGF